MWTGLCRKSCARSSLQNLLVQPQYGVCHLRSCGRSDRKALVLVSVWVTHHCSRALVVVIMPTIRISRCKTRFVNSLVIEVHKKLAVWISTVRVYSESRNGCSIVPRSSWCNTNSIAAQVQQKITLAIYNQITCQFQGHLISLGFFLLKWSFGHQVVLTN